MVVTNTYDGNGRVATQKDAAGLVSSEQTSFGYVDNMDGTQTTTATYPATSYDSGWDYVEVDTHNEDGQLIERVKKPVTSSGSWITETMTYTGDGFLSTMTDGNGNTTTYCYDVAYDGTSISGSFGNLTRRIDPAPSGGADMPVTLFEYDTSDNLIETVSPNGVDSSTSVTCSTDLSSSVDTDFIVNYSYDISETVMLSETVRFNDPDSGLQTAITKYEYDDSSNPGSVTAVIPPRGNTTSTPDYDYATTYEYGASGTQAGMLIEVTEPLTATTTFEYDAVGRMIEMVGPRGNEYGATPAYFATEYVYDDEDRQTFLKVPAPAGGGAQSVTEYQYDEVGNQVVVIDPNGQVVTYDYDERDQLEEVVQSPLAWTTPASPPGTVITTAYEYDHLGNLSRIVRADGDGTYERATDYTYDGLGRLMEEIQYPSWPSTGTTLETSYTYDANSNMLTKTNPLNQTTSYDYDNANRLVEIDYSTAYTHDVDYTYDANGDRLSMVDVMGTTTYTYDEVGRPITITVPGPITTAYRYDLDGNRTLFHYPSGDEVEYTYDEAGRMTEVEDWDTRTTTYEYFVDGLVDSYTQFNGTSTHYTYDNAGRTTQVWNKYGTDTINRFTYTHDDAGYITETEEVLTDGYDPAPIDSGRTGTIDYTYDGMYRLLDEYRDLPFPQGEDEFIYTYDPVGNRLSMEWDNDYMEYVYDKADRLQETTEDWEEEFTVNANGNMTNRDYYGVDYFYDEENRLLEADTGGIIYSYLYTGDGNRIGKWETVHISPVLTEAYVYDVNRPLPLVVQDSLNQYVYGLGLLYLEDDEGNLGFYHLDARGSMRAITDYDSEDDPRVQMYEEYDAFGNEGYSNRSWEQPFKFAGEQRDEDETDLIYLRSRYYERFLCRFMSRDSYMGNVYDPLTLNRYTYVENDPVNKVDPSGHVSNKAGSCQALSYSPVPACQARIDRHLIEYELQYQKNLFDLLYSYEQGVVGLVMDAPVLGVYDLSRRFYLEEGGIQFLAYENYVWDTSSLGNVIWGYHMKRLGYSLPDTLNIANTLSLKQHHVPDPKDDQEQIQVGWLYGD